MAEEETPEVIYVFKQSVGEDLIVKIGRCAKKGNVVDRMKHLQTGSPVQIELLETYAVAPGTSSAVEKFVHNAFVRHRHRQGGKEYFNFKDESEVAVLSRVRTEIGRCLEFLVPTLALNDADWEDWDASKEANADGDLPETVEALRTAKADLEVAKAEIAAYEGKLRAAFAEKRAGTLRLRPWDKVSLSEVKTMKLDTEAFKAAAPDAAASCSVVVIDTDQVKRRFPELFEEHSVVQVTKRLNVGK